MRRIVSAIEFARSTSQEYISRNQLRLNWSQSCETSYTPVAEVIPEFRLFNEFCQPSQPLTHGLVHRNYNMHAEEYPVDRTFSDGETTQGSINLAALESQQGHGPNNTLGGRSTVYDTDTISKKEYYTLRDNRTPNNTATMGSTDLVSKPSGKMKKCLVIMLDGSVHSFDVDQNASAEDLFEVVCDFSGLQEKEYFGLCFRDSTGTFHWLVRDKKITRQIGKADWKFEFMVKFYPPDPENLRENLTRYYLALQIRQNLMADILPCSFITYVILGSYVVQSEIGDFDQSDERMRNMSYLSDVPFCPKEYSQHRELLERVQELHKQHVSMTPEEADLRFLENAKKLAMYGVDMHEVRDSKGEEVYVGVYYGGILVYRNSLRINRFSWPKILKLSYKRNYVKISIRPNEGERDEKLVEFKCPSSKHAKRLWRAIVEHHGFFRLKTPEKPAKPLIPGTFNRKWNYTGHTRAELNENFGTRNEQPIQRKSIRKKDDTYNKHPEYQTGMTNGMESGYGTNQYGTAGNGRGLVREQMDRRPELTLDHPSRWHMLPADASPYLAASLNPVHNLGSVPAGIRDWQGCRADKGITNGGQWYYETTLSSDSGADPVQARLGWSTNSASLMLGQDAHGFGAGTDPNGTAARSLNRGSATPYGIPWNNGDVIGAYVDLDSGLVQFSVNGKEQGPAFTMPPEMRSEVFYPASCMRDGSQAAWNFGDDPTRPLQYLPGAPWRAVGLAPSNNTAENPRAWHLNPHDTTGPGMSLSPDQMAAQGKNGFGWQGIRSNKGIKGANGGKFYYEVEPLEAGGLSRVGWTTETGNLDIGRDAEGWGYGADHDGFGLEGKQGKKLNKDEIENYGEPFSKGDIIGCLFDMDNGQVHFLKNGTMLGPAYTLPITDLNAQVFFPTVCAKDQTLDVNLGQKPFRYPPEEGWTPVCLADEASVRRSARTGVMDASQLPSVDQKYDQIKDSKPQIQGNRQSGYPDTLTSTLESRTETVEIGEPEEEIVTYTDEHGNKITKKVVKRKQARKVITNKVVESVGIHGPPCFDPHSGNGDVSTERTQNGLAEIRKETKTTRRNLILSGDGGEEDDLLNDMIYSQTGLSRQEKVVDDNVNDFSMSTLDRKPKTTHESAV